MPLCEVCNFVPFELSLQSPVCSSQSSVSSFLRNWYHMHHRVTRSFTEEIKVFPLSLAAGAHLGEGGRFISISRYRSCPISKLPFSGGGSQCFQGVRFVR